MSSLLKVSFLRAAAPAAVAGSVATGVGSLPTGGPNFDEDFEKKKRDLHKAREDYEEQQKDPGIWKSIGTASNNMANAPIGSKEKNLEYQAGKLLGHYGSGYIGDTVRMARDNPLNSALLGIILGGGGGALWSLLSGRGDMLGDAIKGALLGGGGLMGLHGINAYFRDIPNLGFGEIDPTQDGISNQVENWFKNPLDFYKSHPPGYPKEASFKKTFKKKASGWGSMSDGNGPFELTMSNIYRSPYPHRIRTALAGEVAGLSPHHRSLLQKLLGGATGAAAVYLIAKFLFNMGSRSTVIATILGGIMGGRSQQLTGMFR